MTDIFLNGKSFEFETAEKVTDNHLTIFIKKSREFKDNKRMEAVESHLNDMEIKEKPECKNGQV